MPEVLVVDCSVAAKWIFREPECDKAVLLLAQWESGEVRLIAPDLLLAEFASLLSKRTRRKQLSAAQAKEAFHLMIRCLPRTFEVRPRLGFALDIALQYQLSVWDSVYIALAIEHGCSMVTADKRLFRGGGARHPVVRMLR